MEPTISANVALGVTGAMKAAFGLRPPFFFLAVLAERLLALLADFAPRAAVFFAMLSSAPLSNVGVGAVTPGLNAP